MVPFSTPDVRAARRATQGFFLLTGIGASAWAPMVPFAQSRLALDKGDLGMVLLCLGIGSTAAMPFAGHLSHRVGNRKVLAVSGALVCLALPLLAVAPSTALLGAALVLFGGAIGVVDVAMNAHAVDVERLHGRPLMSGFHALFSLGGMVGSAGMTALLRAGAPLAICSVAVAVLLAAIVWTQWRKVIVVVVAPGTVQRSMFSRPSSTAILIGALCLVMFLAEGAMLDWSAVLLHSQRGVALTDGGLGYGAFSAAMTVCRLVGDRITAALGPLRVVRWGAAIAAAGFVMACALPWLATSLLGFVLIGIGASNVVPVLFSAAGRMPGTAPGVAIATVTTLGYSGLLAGPAMIGFVSDATSLPIALGGVAALLVAVSASAKVVQR